MFKSKTKPWDDRELDMLDGMKFLNYFAGNIAFDIITTYAVTPNQWWTFVRIVQRSDFVQWLPTYTAIDGFLFLNAFLMTNRCYQIMDAKKMLG